MKSASRRSGHVLRVILLILAWAWAAPIVARAQAAGAVDASGDLETRAALEVEQKKAESQHRTAEAFLLRTRLEKGDFQDGDKILVHLLGLVQLQPGPAGDTVTVRAGRLLSFPNMEDLSLEGVLRSELTGKVSSHIAKYFRDSTVRVIPLLRLAVFGQVGRAGYYNTPTDVLLSDLIMRAGGPGGNADMNNMIIKRGAEVIWNAQDTQTAMADGLSLDRLHLRAGDALYVDDMKGSTNWRDILAIGGSVITVLLTLRSLTR